MCVTFTFVLTENKARVIVTFSPSALFNHSVLFYEGVFKSEEYLKMPPPPATLFLNSQMKSQLSG